MRRRGLIVGAAGLAASAFAGCLGNGQTALSERPPENDVEDGIRTAIGEANVVALELASAREDADDASDVSIDDAALEEQLAAGRQELQSVADADAAADYEAQISAAGSYLDVVEGLLQATATLADVAEQLQGLEQSLQAQDFDAAATELDAIGPDVESARATAGDAESTAGEFDAEALDAYGAKMGELTEGVTTVSNLAVGSDELVTGYQAVLTGRSDLEDGRAAIESGNFAAAESDFQSAEASFGTATGYFETAAQETDGELDTEIQTALCRSTGLTDAAGHFEASAAAAQDGRLGDAQDQQAAGEAALDAVGECGQ
ncbi:hypothetical protein GCM10028857_26730 [Salinarchaeum chitinilyticum]